MSEQEQQPKEYKPCHVVDNFVKPCPSLGRALNGNANGRGKGLNELVYSNLETGEHTQSMIALVSGEFKAPGIILNHCPFCGEKVYLRENHNG